MFKFKKKDYPIVIRKITKEDINSINHILKGSNLPSDTMNNESCYFIVAEYKDKIIGCGCLLSSENLIELRSIAVKKKFQNRGVGSEIVKALIKFAKNKNNTVIYLRTSGSNKFFFSKFGFKEIPQKNLFKLFSECKTCDNYINKCATSLMKIKI